jgi:hypothetical protein
MANVKQVKDDALAIINAALTILDKFPDLGSANVGLSVNTSTNPFTFLMDAFKNTTGYDTLIRILSNFIVVALEPLELTIKGILLSNIKNLISCSINPFIPDDLLRDGIVFDLRQLDITDMLKTCPIDPKIGKYFYFGCDEMTIADETRNSKDFNALLWYMKNRALKREVWNNKREEDESNGKRPSIDKKDEKIDGVITLEYNERASTIKNAQGGAMSIQTPFNNSLHVFIGNSDVMNPPSYENIENINNEIQSLNDDIKSIENEITQIEEDEQNALTSFEEQHITQEEYEQKSKSLQEQKENKYKEIDNKTQEIKFKSQELQNAKSIFKQSLSSKQYKDIKLNYYYRKTLIEFNYDYIMSLKLFDAKVVAAQLLDQLTGLLNIDLSLSYARQLIKNETIKMVQDIVESDDTVVSDCFFSFSNTDYDKMLQKSELVRSGLFTINGEENSSASIDPASILDSLNGINANATQEEILSIIEGSLTEISGTISNVNYEEKGNVNFGVRMNFIENLMNHLACVITFSVLSPKLYLLILINLKTLGMETNFNLNDFIAMFKQLIVALIRGIRDALIQYLVDELMKLLSDIAAAVAVKISTEQALYYARLIKRLIYCLKRKDQTFDWQMDEVNHADIIQENEEPKNAEC